MGCGGIIPIQVSIFPTSTYLELKLTGMQGDVMKESMSVAKTLAISLPPIKKYKKAIDKEKFKETGIHIHCPEGAIPKDGPSAGTAITLAIYSSLHNIKIKNHIGVTGEITLQGNVTKIGGLDLKIIGGIRAGITEFIVPKQNEKDYINFIEKHATYKDVKIHFIEYVSEAFSIIFV
tara:strand:- start:273 stop:803 length:531 start_codon:yes stop_codon:yes gene_type:complete